MSIKIGALFRGRRAGTRRSIWSDPATKPPANAAILTVTSTSYDDGAPLPRTYAGPGAGDNTWPDLGWSGVPSETKAIVVWLEDVDAPTRAPLVHTVAVVRPDVDRLPEGTLDDSHDLRLVRASFWLRRYHGPGPIPGHGPHTYRFLVLALDAEPTDAEATDFHTLRRAMAGHVLARGMRTCTYER